MQPQRLRRKLICAATVCALGLGAIQAADAGGSNGYKKRIIETFWKCVYFPSVDYYGCLNWYCTTKGKCKVIINHRKGTCYALGSSRVKNESHCNQSYCNEGVINGSTCENCCWYKELYTVDKKGRCRVVAWGTYSEYGCECDGGGYENGPVS